MSGSRMQMWKMLVFPIGEMLLLRGVGEELEELDADPRRPVAKWAIFMPLKSAPKMSPTTWPKWLSSAWPSTGSIST